MQNNSQLRRRIVESDIDNPILETDDILTVAEKVKVGDWREFFDQDETRSALKIISKQIKQNEELYGKVIPKRKHIYRGFQVTPLKKLKVVFFGQDPYYDRDQKGRLKGIGPAFCQRKDAKRSPSMLAMYKDIQLSYPDFEIPEHGWIIPWAEQGVLLLNTKLTVHEGMPDKFNNFWKSFISLLLEYIRMKKPNTIFVMWGAPAQKLEKDHLDGCYNLSGVHPAARGYSFVGCGHFKKINLLLESLHKKPIDWTLPVNYDEQEED